MNLEKLQTYGISKSPITHYVLGRHTAYKVLCELPLTDNARLPVMARPPKDLVLFCTLVGREELGLVTIFVDKYYSDSTCIFVNGHPATEDGVEGFVHKWWRELFGPGTRRVGA